MTVTDSPKRDDIELRQPPIDLRSTLAGAGTIAVTADESGRFTRFAISMQGLQTPAGSRTLWQVGNDIAGNRNRAAADITGDWLWFVDDDHVFDPGILHGLLAHDVDIVAPLVLRRHNPFSPVACDLDGNNLALAGKPTGGLREVLHTGSSGMLIKRAVIDAIDAPWFELGNGVSEDVAFCQKARAAGFKIHVDLGRRMGHLTVAAVWPVADDTLGWVTGFTIADGFQLAIDPA